MKQLSKKKVKERRKKGTVKAYMSRAVAIRKLQISLSDFRRLCILKGVYPVEPRNKSKLTGANTRRKTYFFTRDIQMLMNEPLLFKFSEFKTFMRRLTRAKGRHDREGFEKQMDNKPFYKLDLVVKERYPRFIDALRDCDDALSMCFLFAMFPKGPGRPDDLIELSRKLTVEFMHYIINSKSLRKVFISIKGYYYQADIMGQTVTWLVPHQFVIDRVSNVDLNVMRTFTEFYVTMMGFINYKLYKSINAVYPPQVIVDNLKEIRESRGLLDEVSQKKRQSKKRKMPDDELEELAAENRDDLIAALNKHIRILENKAVSKIESADQQPDVFDGDEEDESVNKEGEKKLTVQDVMLLERLFEGCKFFLNRETPRESLTFVIRSFGGEVSWDKNLFPGATFDESDPSITYQIVDRPSLSERRLNRVYIQPQWVYDSINMRMLLPTTEYLVGATLPPHLSPFVNEKRGDYVPPDKIKLMNLRKQFEAEKASEERVNKGQSGVESDLETDNELENATGLGGDTEGEEDEDAGTFKKRFKPNARSDKDDIDSFDSKRSRERLDKNRRKRERDSNKSTSRSKMSVKTGKLKIEDKEELAKKEDAEYRKMGIMMIPKKRKRLFDKITRTQKERKQKTEKLRDKRRIVDEIRSRKKGSAK